MTCRKSNKLIPTQANYPLGNLGQKVCVTTTIISKGLIFNTSTPLEKVVSIDIYCRALKEMLSASLLVQSILSWYYLTIGSCFSVHYRVMERAGSMKSTKEA